MLAENVKERIVLNGCQRQFKYVADEIWHHRAAAAALRFQVSYIRHRHVVRELIRSVPIEVAVHSSCAEAARAESLGVFIDLSRSLEKILLLLIEVPIMVQIMDIEFESAASY